MGGGGCQGRCVASGGVRWTDGGATLRLIPFLLVAALLLVCIRDVPTAAATSQEKIFFDRGDPFPRQIFSINPDGSGLTQLTFDAGGSSNPAVSPDGTKIAFDHNGDIYVMDIGGGNVA